MGLLGSKTYQPLEGNDDGFEKNPPRTAACPTGYSILVTIIAIISICLNFLMFSYILTTRWKSEGHNLSKFAGLPLDEHMTFEVHSGFSDDNDTIADSYWDLLDTSPGAITLSDQFAIQNGIPIADRFPWNDKKGFYWISGFHDLHCLKIIRHSISEYRRGVSQSLAKGHISHCLDALRQRIICSASDTPMHSINGRPRATGDGMIMQCRSWEKLTAWANAPEREACYEWIDEYRTMPAHMLERYGFCPKDSEDFPEMQRYFDVHGHVDAWGSNDEEKKL
ncbi:hypothetical protein B0J14DRAFT_688680 [Halenospora varia]|nr:hypothetical protein B0J14DRAFT_688680 [Halenospora varia]